MSVGVGVCVCAQNRNNKYIYTQKNHSGNCNVRLYLSWSDNQKRLALLNCSAIYFIADKSEINDMEHMKKKTNNNNDWARQVTYNIHIEATKSYMKCVYAWETQEKHTKKYRRNPAKDSTKIVCLRKYQTTTQRSAMWSHGMVWMCEIRINEQNQPKCEAYTKPSRKVILLSPGCVFPFPFAAFHKRHF